MSDITNNELFELMSAQFNKVNTDLEFIAVQVSNLTTRMEESFTSVKADIAKIDNRLIVIENDHGAKLDAILDGYKQLAEGQEELKAEIKELSSRQENQEFEIRVLKNKAK